MYRGRCWSRCRRASCRCATLPIRNFVPRSSSHRVLRCERRNCRVTSPRERVSHMIPAPPPPSMPSGPRYTPSLYDPRAPLLPALIRRCASRRFARRSRRFARRLAIESQRSLEHSKHRLVRSEPVLSLLSSKAPYTRLGRSSKAPIVGSRRLADHIYQRLLVGLSEGVAFSG